MNTPPLCDIDPKHGAMTPEHIYLLNGNIDQRFGVYWFCQVEGCDGYGGAVENHNPIVLKNQILSQQMEMNL